MAIANLLIKIGADISELQVNSDKAVRSIEKTGQKIDSIGSSIKSTLLASFSVGAVVGFANELLRMGDDIVRTADRTGLLTDEVQKLSFIAGQSGNSIDELTGGIGQMQNRLASGDKSALSAVRDLGLSFETLRSQSPYDQLESIAESIAKIPNPATRAQVAMDLFGKSGIAILPTLTSHFKELAKAAPVMSDNTVRALDDAGDVFDKFTLQIKVWAAESYNFFGRVMDAQIAGLYRLIAGMYDATAGVVKLAAKIPGASKVFGDLTDNVASLTESSRWYVDAAKGLEGATTKGANAAKAAVPPFNSLTDGTDKLTDAQKKAKAATEAHAKSVADLRDQLSGRGSIRAAQDMVQALRGISIASVDASGNTKRVNETFGEALDVYKALGQQAPEAMRKIYRETIPFLTEALPLLNRFKTDLQKLTPEAMIPLINVMDRAWPQTIEGLKLITPIVGKVTGEFKTLGETIRGSIIETVQKIPQTIASAFTGGGGLIGAFKAIGVQLADAIATPIIAGLSKLQKVTVGVGSSAAAAFGGATGGGMAATVGSIASGLGGAALAASSWGASMAAAGTAGTLALGAATLGIGAAAVGVALLIKHVMGMTEYEKRMRAAATETQKLQAQLLYSHAGMQQLIIDADLVGINIKEAFNWKDPEALKSIISELDAKTQLLTAAMEEYGFTWEDLGEKARGAKLGQLFDELKAKTDILKGAGIDYHEILLRQSADYSDLVNAAIRTGTEIPISMKPILEDLVEMGTLVDENGQSFTDLGKVTWAKTLTQGFDQVTDAIYDLRDAITNGVGGALDDLGRKVVHPRIAPVYDEPGGGDNSPGYATGTRGAYIDYGAGTDVTLHGRERIMTEHEALGVDGGDAFTLSAPNALRLLRGEIVTVTRNDAARGGLRTRASNGRSY